MNVVVGGADAPGDAFVAGVLAGREWAPGADAVRAALEPWLDAELDRIEFTGAEHQVAMVPGAGAVPYGTVVLVGLGESATADGLRRAAGTAARRLSRAGTVVTTLHRAGPEDAAAAVVAGFRLGQYRFDRYKSEAGPAGTASLVLAGGSESDGTAAARGEVLADAVALARDLVNDPAGARGPLDIAELAGGLGAEHGFTVEVTAGDAIGTERLGGLEAVGRGSARPPCMLVMTYEPAQASGTLAFVGKGIVFDSGGLSLKPPKAMETMKTDMAGAAAVIGAMTGVARLGAPVRLVAITPLADNMPGGAAQRPGDILRARNGKTIEVLNTDAEGRLVLADGLSLAAEQEPDLIVDLATLTGACKVALGPHIAGAFGNDDAALARVEAAAARAGERVWRMPLPGDYRTMIDSPIADMKNTGERWGGAITAALLLREFVGDTPWVHLDIAGPARADKDDGHVTQGGTGFGVATLLELARSAS